MVHIARHLSVYQVRYKVEEEVVDLIDLLILEDEQLSLLSFYYVESASILGLISKQLCDILIKHVLIIILVIVFVLLFLLPLFLLLSQTRNQHQDARDCGIAGRPVRQPDRRQVLGDAL